VRSAERTAAGFVVDLDGSAVAAKRLVLATGVGDALPDIDGASEHYGASLFHCPSCDGYEARDQNVVVLGWSEHVAGFALTLLDWAGAVMVVTGGRTFEGGEPHVEALVRHGIRLLETERAVELCGTRGALTGVRLSTGEVVPATVAFFTIAHEPHNALARSLGCDVTPEGCVLVDDDGQTSVPGVYAAGDLTPGVQLIQVAAAKGTVAGVHCAHSLRGDGTVAASPDPAPDVDAEVP
jgi:thioredoxin reductase